ncbi:uncharacterized protein C1orf94-like [Mustelus asterias]
MLAKLELAHAQKDGKCSFPLGPYPRYTWIHEDTPEDGLDKACFEIWKRVQQLTAQLNSGQKVEREEEVNGDAGEWEMPEAGGKAKEEKALDRCGKDDVSLLVHLEYMSIMGENANLELCQSKPGEKCQAEPVLEHSIRKDVGLPGSSEDKGNFLNNILKSVGGTEQVPKKGGLAKEEAAELLQLDSNTGGASVASNKEICQLLAQFSLKHINEAEAPDNKVVMEEAQVIKDFLQNNMFSCAGDKKVEASPPPLSSGGSQEEQARRQLPVFAKLCEEPAPALKPERRQPAAAPGAFERREAPKATGHAIPVDAGLQAEPGDELAKLLCPGPKEPDVPETPHACSPELKEKAQGGTGIKSEHSYSTSRHALKGMASSTRKEAAKDVGKGRDMPGQLAAAKHKEDFGLAKCGGCKEIVHKMVAFTLADDDARMAVAKRDCLPLEKHDLQDAEPVPGRASSDSLGSECTTGSMDEDNTCGQSLQLPGATKDGTLFPSQTEAEPSGSEGMAISYQDKNTSGANLQLPGAAYDCGSKYGTNVYPSRFPSGTLPMPSRPPLINYPPVPPGPPAAPSTPGYTQHQSFYQPRTMRMPHQQPTYQQTSCFVRPTNPYNYSQMAQEYVPRQAYIRATYAPLVGYWSFVPEYSYTARNAPKPLTGGTNPPPMAGDGPQCLFQPAYGYLESNITATRFSSSRTGPVYNSSNFQMYYPADGSGYNYW